MHIKFQVNQIISVLYNGDLKKYDFEKNTSLKFDNMFEAT